MSKILVVDDIGYIRYSVINMLKKRGYAAASAENGTEALNILRKDASISVVLTDGPMPGCSGFELLRACQKFERHHDEGQQGVPDVVLMVTPDMAGPQTNHPYFQPDNAEAYGFAGVLIKPINEAALIKCLRAIENKARPVAQAATQAARPAAASSGVSSDRNEVSVASSSLSSTTLSSTTSFGGTPIVSPAATSPTNSARAAAATEAASFVGAAPSEPTVSQSDLAQTAGTLRAIKKLVDDQLREFEQLASR